MDIQPMIGLDHHVREYPFVQERIQHPGYGCTIHLFKLSSTLEQILPSMLEKREKSMCRMIHLLLKDILAEIHFIQAQIVRASLE